MKREKLRTFLAALVLSLAAAIGGTGCLATGFSLNILHPGWILACWFFTAVLAAAMYFRRRGGRILFLLTLLALVLFWFSREARGQTVALILKITRIYDQTYHWGFPTFSGNYPETTSVDLPLGMLGGWILLSVCRTVSTRSSSSMTYLLVGLPLWLCLIVADTVPDSWVVFLLLGVLAMLLLAENVRVESTEQSSRLMAMAAIPLAFAIWVLALAAPKETYVNHAAHIQDAIFSLASDLPDHIREEDFQLPISDSSNVDLRNLGDQKKLGIPVMDLLAENSGTLYLRGQDYDRYTRTGWESSSGRSETFSGQAPIQNRIALQTKAAMPAQYIAYYPAPETVLNDGRIRNAEKRTEFVLECFAPAAAPFPSEAFLALPESTASDIAEILNGIPGSFQSTDDAAAAIQDFVRQAAEYNRASPAMPDSASDFAVWFLTDAKEGYCVHFATAAAVLLRSVGVPARYVTGFKVDARAGVPITVTTDDAHAWVEYYNYTSHQWSILETTPVDTPAPPPTEETTPPTEAERPQPTQPVPTEVPSPEPSKPEAWRVPPILWWLLAIPALLGAVILQRRLRLELRRRQQTLGDPNSRCLAHWKETVLLAKLLSQTPPEELEDLALKAKFSQHQLTEEELEAFRVFQQTARREIGENRGLKKLICKYYYCAC